ncbi:MAG TPA: hypothetical protein VMF06_05595 [Candidatus Limnocylindria bacterium]|jgi:hypothetical protein|nr:hypothetical protein [Candidatus Limnocylindria bacterium]
MKKIASMLLAIAGSTSIVIGSCYTYHPYLCHSKTSGTMSLSCSFFSAVCCPPNTLGCTITYSGLPTSTTDGNRGLMCDSGGSASYCNPDTIPDGCTWSESSWRCPGIFEGCFPIADPKSHTATLNTVVSGGTCITTAK